MNISYARRMHGVRPSAIRELLQLGADPEVISFGGGYPDPLLFPMQDLNATYSSLLTAGNASALQYTVSDGLPSLRSHVASRLSQDGTACTFEDVLIVQGGQQGLDLVAKLLLDPGDVVITENPTFAGALIAFNPYEPIYASVNMDGEGMDMEHLEQVLAANPNAKFIYTVPDFQNPTGVTMSLERRMRLVELANRFDVVIVEDTPYRDLRYSGTSVPTIKSMDTEGRVVHLGSFSKILAPGMRLGWVIASKDMLSNLGLLKLAADTQSSTLNMAATSTYLDNYDIDAHVERIRLVYGRKRDLMLKMLSEHFPAQVQYTVPDGGLFTWLTFPEWFDAAAFMKEEMLPKAKIAYVPGATFFPVAQEDNHARVSFSGVSEDQIRTGISRLGELLRAKIGN